jgi:hypothetical protein
LWDIGIGNQTSEQIDQKVEATAMTRMLNLIDVFELVIDRFDRGSFAQQNLAHELDEAIFHVLTPPRNQLQTLGIKLLIPIQKTPNTNKASRI